jgi:hypothetical protein
MSDQCGGDREPNVAAPSADRLEVDAEVWRGCHADGYSGTHADVGRALAVPSRSIKLKLVVPRDDAGRTLRSSLWTTHDEVNTAARYYEQRLLVLRGLPYDPSARGEQGGAVSAEDSTKQSLAAARSAQRTNLQRNGHAQYTCETDEEVLAAMQRLFHLIAPDETSKTSANPCGRSPGVSMSATRRSRN